MTARVDKTMRYWHGGQRGLRVGDFILPPSDTNAKHTIADYGTVAAGVARRDRVYVGTDENVAILYAATHPSGGGVYEVKPVGELTPDVDCDAPGLSWECERALIVSARDLSSKTRNRVIRAITRGVA
jgi:hypothetical protein